MPRTQLHHSMPRKAGPSGGRLLDWLFELTGAALRLLPRLMLLQLTELLKLLLMLMLVLPTSATGCRETDQV